MLSRAKKWIWGVSGTTKYAVKDLTEIQIIDHPVTQKIQVVARKRIGWEKVLLKNCSTKQEAKQFINDNFPNK